ncbi:MAG: Lrp/AsnC family transcriptional regulator [Rhizobiaceae bacterium]
MKILDDIDRKILRELELDGRKSNNQLAEAVGLSSSPCWQRVRRLEKDGIIKGYSTVIDQLQLGYPETVLVEITLERNGDYLLEDICHKLADIPEVLEVHITSGAFDCFIKVAVSGTQGYEEFLRTKLYNIPGIKHSHSVFSLRCFKNNLSFVP